jgi:hypothetical protein
MGPDRLIVEVYRSHVIRQTIGTSQRPQARQHKTHVREGKRRRRNKKRWRNKRKKEEQGNRRKEE